MNNKTPKECKSNITLEDIRPYISCIHGYFGVPFDDSGFFMNDNEIAVSREKYDGYFKKYTAMILGISEEEVCSKLTKKSIGGDVCWKHNRSYELKTGKIKEPSISISIYDDMSQRFRISFNNRYSYTDGSIGSFYIDINGIIYQTTLLNINSIEDIAKIFIEREKADILKELTKMKKAEKTAEKSLNTIKTKVRELENKLNNL